MLGLKPMEGQEEDGNRKMVSVTFVQKANMDKDGRFATCTLNLYKLSLYSEPK